MEKQTFTRLGLKLKVENEALIVFTERRLVSAQLYLMVVKKGVKVGVGEIPPAGGRRYLGVSESSQPRPAGVPPAPCAKGCPSESLLSSDTP